MGRKWENIKTKKAANDTANSKVYGKFGTEIYVAASRGGSSDPEANSTLKFTIERAKQAQVPKHIIERALQKAEGGGDETFSEGRYEGFGPNGSLIIVDTLTSNVNRTAANVRQAYNKNGGNFGNSGSVSYLFDETGLIIFKGDNPDSILEILLNDSVNVLDVEQQEENIIVTTEPSDLHKAIASLKNNGIEEFETTEIEMIPQSEVKLEGEDLETFEKLIDALEDDEDVQKVYHNVAM
jgi:YebC/PmpR family DNA-binding regulatory protein